MLRGMTLADLLQDVAVHLAGEGFGDAGGFHQFELVGIVGDVADGLGGDVPETGIFL